MFRKVIATSSSWATIPIRLALAAIMIAHGSQKVLGAYGGPGLKAWTSGNTPFSFMRPAWLWLGAAAISELVGGALLGFGFLTRVGAFAIFCTMLTAIVGVHWPNFFASNKGYEYPLAIFAMSFSLLISGGGMASIDQALGGKRRK
jgi:putative oxidoreductase